MQKLIAATRELIEQAEAIKQSATHEQRRELPLTEPPLSCWPGDVPSEQSNRLLFAAQRLYDAASDVREKGFWRVQWDGQQIIAGGSPQDLEDHLEAAREALKPFAEDM